MTQILLLTGILLVMLIFRHHIGDTVSTLMSSFGNPASDVQVQQPATPSSEQNYPMHEGATFDAVKSRPLMHRLVLLKFSKTPPSYRLEMFP